jgi:hypothetical protein
LFHFHLFSQPFQLYSWPCSVQLFSRPFPALFPAVLLYSFIPSHFQLYSQPFYCTLFSRPCTAFHFICPGQEVGYRAFQIGAAYRVQTIALSSIQNEHAGFSVEGQIRLRRKLLIKLENRLE